MPIMQPEHMALPLNEAEQETLRNCLRNLATLEGCEVVFDAQEGQEGTCGLIRLQAPWGRLSLQALVYLRISPKTADLLLQKTEINGGQKKFLLLTDFLSENIAARFRARKISFMDSSGNTFLHHPPLHVEISGRKRNETIPSGARPFQKAGLQLIFLLLTNPAAPDWTYRQLAKEAGIALGAVGTILNRLEKLGYLAGNRSKGRTLNNGQALLQRWELGFSETLRTKIFLQTCRLSAGLAIKDLLHLLQEKGLNEDILVGGELGAHLLLDHSSPQSAVLHLSGETLKTMLRLRLVPDPSGNIDLWHIFGPGNRWQGWTPDNFVLADPLLMHADIAHRGNLSPDLNHKFLETYLLPRMATFEKK